jgi:hypothetical protein
MIKACGIAGSICMYQGLNDISVRYFTRRYELAEKPGGIEEMGASNFNLAALQLANENFPIAKQRLLEPKVGC